MSIRQAQPVLALLAALLVVPALPACGGGGKVIKTEEVVVEEAPEPPDDDAFRDYLGTKVDPGEPFDIDAVGAAVRGVEIVVTLSKVNTSSWTNQMGEEVVDGTAILEVSKGTEKATLRIEKGKSATAFGAEIEVIEATIDYNIARFKYLPYATLIVRAAGK